MTDLREDVIKKLEEERKQKEEELQKILKEIEEKSNQLKKEKEIEEMIKEMELHNREENSEGESLDEGESEEKKKIEEELTLNYESRPLANLYKSNEENSLYNLSLTTMQNVYETAKSLSQASREGNLSENELNVISTLEEKLEGTNQNYIPSERAVMLLQTSKSILNEIRKYNS